MIYFEDDEVYHEAARKVFEKTRGLKSNVSSNVILTDQEAIKQAQSIVKSSGADEVIKISNGEVNNGS